MINYDLHIHTEYCGHAPGMTVEAILRQADILGLETIAITSHIFAPENLAWVRCVADDVKAVKHNCQVIIGAESIGSHPGRECRIEWVRNIVNQCKAAGVGVFVKQIHMWTGYSISFQGSVYSEVKTGVCQKRVLLKYPRDKKLFPLDLQCWEYPERQVNK